MNQRAVIVVLVMCAACGGSKPEPQAPSNGSAETELRCKTAVERAAEHVKTDPKDVTMAIGECEQKEWSRQARECLAAVQQAPELVTCATKFDLAKHGMFADGSMFDEAIKQMIVFKDQFCACKDSPCATKVSDDMTKWAQANEKKFDAGSMKLTDEQTKRATAIGEEMGKCMQKAMGGSPTP